MPEILSKCNPDIEKERKKCTFNTKELTFFLDKGEDKTEERKALENYFLNDPELKPKIPIEYLSHKEKYIEAIRLSCLLFKKINTWLERQDGGNAMEAYQSVLGGSLGSAILKEGYPFAVHYVMFIPTIMGQGTMAQQAYWISRAWNCEIMCTYAQTELGHGTFIRGLETTATYDPTTEEFILNSPTLTSYKWWPGGLGHTCNYAVVLAQLYTKGKCHGIHPFVVQLRDEDTWLPMPGIKIGEIGCKLGMNTVNNGYLGFEHVRIPRDRMLMKNNKVLKDGTYVKSQNEKLTYGTMIFVRVVIVRGVAATSLAKAVTIATRYSAVRRQSEMKPGEPEPQIVEYQTQQYKLFPGIATVFALNFSASWLWDVYNSVSSDLEHGDLEKLPELHAMSCCLKAVSSKDATNMIETCRLACGGHGYMTSSSFPNVYGTSTAAVTYEGENTVLLLQTARYLVKAWHQASSSSNVAGTLKYLQDYKTAHMYLPWEESLPCIVRAFQLVAASKIKNCAENVDNLVKEGVSPEDAWNRNSIQLTQAAEAHCRAFIVDTFVNQIKDLKVSESLLKVLRDLCELYSVYWLLNNLGDFLMYSNLKASDVPRLQKWQEKLLASIRPNAVGLVDSFDIHDDILGSALGAYDGRVYERLFEEANKSPLNAEPVNESFHKYLKPFLKSNI
ncbi:probable peroxisomal acyl-coenzyme A oxidase 1 [Planococcus citri]|uniref:probable peroxisomal acyl-coenzyme A oxidase 1 n=1 Tax=Planococcus citri TaxID=170843 RepID=UPI0031F769DF